MKILTNRALVLLIMCGLIFMGMMGFLFKYINEASNWATHPYNKNIYENGRLTASGKIFDRNGELLYQTENGQEDYFGNENKRKAMLHAIGDDNQNISTSAKVAFRDKLSGYSLLNGTYRFNNKLIGLGNDVNLTIDSEVSAYAYKLLNGRSGTIGVYNYKTGEIICMATSPSFDPENPPNIENNPERYEGVYINRLLLGRYTPGSIFKLVTATAALEQIEGIEGKTYNCTKEKIIGDKVVICQSEHGEITFSQALASSCNIAFAEISLELSGKVLQKYAEKAGINDSINVNGIDTARGNINLKEAEGADLAWGGIGQYTDTVNPLNFMAFMGAVANEGKSVRPKLLMDEGLYKIIPDGTLGTKRMLKKETANELKALMRNNVISEYGDDNYKDLSLCAKSGTAQVGGDKEHSWFVGFMDREDYPLAFVVIIENGGSGSKVAGPVAGKVLKEIVEGN